METPQKAFLPTSLQRILFLMDLCTRGCEYYLSHATLASLDLKDNVKGSAAHLKPRVFHRHLDMGLTIFTADCSNTLNNLNHNDVGL